MRLWKFVALLQVVLADYYDTLEISKDASDRDIKKAYRNLSKKYHPDKNPGDEDAHHKFIEISEAYDVLSNEEKRKLYDEYGEEGVKNGAPPPNRHPGGFDFFNQMFGGQPQQQGRPKVDDTHVEVTATLKEFYNGQTKVFGLNMRNVCDHCKGSRSEDGKDHKCTTCGGSGFRIMTKEIAMGMYQQIRMPCQTCQGQGRVIEHLCHKCGGQGVVETTRNYEIHVAAGSERNHVEKLEQEGHQQPEMDPGDLLVIIKETKEGNMGYRRKHHDLYRTEMITLKEAIQGGWSRNIGFLDKDEPELLLERKQGQIVVDGEVEVIKGKGMPYDGDEYGDLYVEYRVVYPGGKVSSIKDEL